MPQPILIPMQQRVEILSENLRRVIDSGYISGRTYQSIPTYDVTTATGLVYENLQKTRIKIIEEPEHGPRGYCSSGNGAAIPYW